MVDKWEARGRSDKMRSVDVALNDVHTSHGTQHLACPARSSKDGVDSALHRVHRLQYMLLVALRCRQAVTAGDGLAYAVNVLSQLPIIRR
jgi:hypothetical protein